MLIERYGQRLPHSMFPILVQHLGPSDTIKVFDKTINDLEKYRYDPNQFTLAAVDLSRREDYYNINRINESILAFRKDEPDLIRAIIRQVEVITAGWVDLDEMRSIRDIRADYKKPNGQADTIRLPTYHEMACRLQYFEVSYLMATLYNLAQKKRIIKMLNERLRCFPYHPLDPQWTHNPIETRYIMYVALYIRASIRDTVSLDFVEGVNKNVQAAMHRQEMKWAMDLRSNLESVIKDMQR